MINDNPNLKPIYYAFLPKQLTISILKSIPIGFAYKVIDDMEDFDLGKKYTINEFLLRIEKHRMKLLITARILFCVIFLYLLFRELQNIL